MLHPPRRDLHPLGIWDAASTKSSWRDSSFAFPAEQPEHGRRQRGSICSRARRRFLLPCWASRQRGQSCPWPWGTAPSPRGSAQLLWPGTVPCHLPWGSGGPSCRAQPSRPTLCPLERPKCGTGTPGELQGAALAPLQLSRARPDSPRALLPSASLPAPSCARHLLQHQHLLHLSQGCSHTAPDFGRFWLIFSRFWPPLAALG